MFWKPINDFWLVIINQNTSNDREGGRTVGLGRVASIIEQSLD